MVCNYFCLFLLFCVRNELKLNVIGLLSWGCAFKNVQSGLLNVIHHIVSENLDMAVKILFTVSSALFVNKLCFKISRNCEITKLFEILSTSKDKGEKKVLLAFPFPERNSRYEMGKGACIEV